MTEVFQWSLYIMAFIFLGTLLGVVVVMLISKVFHKNSFYLNVFCGGVLAGILGFDLIPELMTNYRPIGLMAGISMGIFFMILMERFIHNTKYAQIDHPETFMLLFLALLFHSIPTGIALGIDYQGDHFQDSALLGAILIHHIPEGMVMMVSVIYSRMKVNVFLIFCFLLSLGVGINTYLGITLDFQSIKLRTMFMGIAIGTLGYVTFYEILWRGLKEYFTIKMFITAMLGIIFLKFYLALNSFAH